jgi:hypothetical protein
VIHGHAKDVDFKVCFFAILASAWHARSLATGAHKGSKGHSRGGLPEKFRKKFVCANLFMAEVCGNRLFPAREIPD